MYTSSGLKNVHLEEGTICLPEPLPDIEQLIRRKLKTKGAEYFEELKIEDKSVLKVSGPNYWQADSVFH